MVIQLQWILKKRLIFYIMIFNKCFKKFGFCENFICWTQVLLNDQQSCVINGEFTTPYFNLEKGARQGDYISAYLFIPALEVSSFITKPLAFNI